MKRLICVALAFLMLFVSGCTVIYDDTSSGTYYDYFHSSDTIYVYEDGSSAVDEVISQIDAEINSKVQAGEATVSTTVSTYVTDDYDDNYSGESGKQTTIIDSSVKTDEVEEIVEADVNTTGEKPLYYTYLTETQQRIYRLMKTAAEQMKTGFFSLGAVSGNEDRFTDIAIAFRALSSDNPQIFWLPNVYIMSPDGSSLAFAHTEKGADYTFTQEQQSIANQQLTSTVYNLAAQANRLSSRFEKELFFHDWLCENVTYADDGTDAVFTAYGALVNGVAVCEGYSRAMQLLCDSVGIPCTVLYGKSNGIGHMWNLINPGDGWYHLDVTWDDDEKYGLARRAYVNLSDEQITLDHKIFDAVATGKTYVGDDDFNICLFACNKDKYNYFNKKNLVFTVDTDAAADIVMSAGESGDNSVEVLYTDNSRSYESYLNEVNRILYERGANIWIERYSYLGNAVALWW